MSAGLESDVVHTLRFRSACCSLQVAKRQKTEQVPGMLSVKAKEMPWPPDQPPGTAQTPLEPASPATQPVSCQSAMQDWDMPATEVAPAQDLQRLRDTAFSGKAVTQAIRQRLDTDDAAPKATNGTQAHGAAESLLSASQTCGSHKVVDGARQLEHQGMCAGSEQEGRNGQKVEGRKGKSRPSSWQRKKAAKQLQQARQLQNEDAVFAAENGSGKAHL